MSAGSGREHNAPAGFRRFQSGVPDSSGAHAGLFSLMRGLAVGGSLGAVDRREWERMIARSYELHVEPTTVDPHCYSAPGSRSWFRDSAEALLALARDGCGLLDRYGVPWVELRTAHPGRITYADDVQVVARPFAHRREWQVPHPPD